MRVLGIDPGTCCGWAVLDPDGARLASGTWDLKPRRHDGGGMRYVYLRRYLAELCTALEPQAIGYEAVRRHRGVDAAHVYGGIVATLTAVAESRTIPYQGLPVAQVKRAATGKGNASKEMMVEAAQAKWGPVSGHDEADALWIAWLLLQEV